MPRARCFTRDKTKIGCAKNQIFAAPNIFLAAKSKRMLAVLRNRYDHHVSYTAKEDEKKKLLSELLAKAGLSHLKPAFVREKVR